jgi:tRNA-dihydrouridine synthase B
MSSFVRPITLGKLKLASNLVQAPLAGYSCAPFRLLAHRYGAPGFCCSEMISAQDLVQRKHKPRRLLWRDPQEGLLCYQLAGRHAEYLAGAAAIVSEAGADIIDLNCGCPVNKIRKKGLGSKLLADPEHLYALLVAIKQNTDAVVSVKLRIAGQWGDHDDLAVLDAVQSAGVGFVTVHGRHWRERYDVPCDNAAIARIVKAAKVPVLANGDVDDHASMQALFAQTGCAGVMIARASVGRPWLFRQLALGVACAPPTAEIGALFIEHLTRLAALENEHLAVLQARKLAKYYARGRAGQAAWLTYVQKQTSLPELVVLIRDYFSC